MTFKFSHGLLFGFIGTLFVGMLRLKTKKDFFTMEEILDGIHEQQARITFLEFNT